MNEKMETEWQFEFPPDVQAEREVVLAALDRAMQERTIEAVREAGALAWAWVAKHPEDYAVWDAGEPVAMLGDALETLRRQAQEREPAVLAAG